MRERERKWEGGREKKSKGHRRETESREGGIEAVMCEHELDWEKDRKCVRETGNRFYFTAAPF